MIIPSIDLMKGRAVQLVGGKRFELDAGDPRDWAKRFGLVGTVAVVDLDAALAQGENRETILELLEVCRCRVGGGIRRIESAIEWLDAGAESIVIGTSANPEFLRQLPRDRVVVALDALHDEVVVEGWRKGTGTKILERIRALRDFASSFLVTFVECEGKLEGTRLDAAAAIAHAADGARVTIAGGITTPEEVAALDQIGCDAQVGMALYRGRLDLVEAFAAPLQSDRPDGLWPTVVVDEHDVALGLAWSNRNSLRLAIESRRGVYFSRSRNGLWIKGEQSGATQELLEVAADCDRDALRFRVRQLEPGFCHKNTRTCWGPSAGLPGLSRRLAHRRHHAIDGSYTQRLFGDPQLLNSKIVEEASELAAAGRPEHVAEEAADLIYFTLTKLHSLGIPLESIERILNARQRKISRRGGNAKPTTSHLPLNQCAFDSLKTISLHELPPRIAPTIEREFLNQVRPIMQRVELEGEAGLRTAIGQFENRSPNERLLYDSSDLLAARQNLDLETVQLLERTAGRIRTFASAQLATLKNLEISIPGGNAGSTWHPLGVAGCYSPGGRFPLVSSVLMTTVTARVAGVREAWVASPIASPLMLAAAGIAGASGFLHAGGAHAIAALATGCCHSPCDVIVGPGNRWVTAAKHLVSDRLRIDMLAGPSELLIAADEHARVDWIAADLLAQAEHDAEARPLLVTTCSQLIDHVNLELRRQLVEMPTREIAQAALKNGFALLVRDRAEMREAISQIAPEHLELHLADADEFARTVTHCGCVFLGDQTAEAFGDYGAGPNHVLPTSGTARWASGLSVETFLRRQSWLKLDSDKNFPAGKGESLRRDAISLARLEGLAGHVASIRARLEESVDPERE